MAGEEFGKELAAIDFGTLIGAPMIATINAQAQSAMKTLEFISNPIFISKDKKIQTIEFTYDKQVPAADGTTQAEGQRLSIPLITMAPIPYIRIESLMIDLNIKLHSTQTTKTENELNVQTDASSSSWWNPVSMHVKVTDKNTYSNNTTVDREYSMHVQVRAVQDQMPGGLGKILEILEQTIQSQSGEKK